MTAVGIKDVAEKAGVSVTTVSRVLNKRGYISEETYKKVYDAIEELNYTPNQLARSLFRQKSDVIGLVIPDVSHPFFCELTKNIETLLYEKNYKLLLCNTIGKSNRERDYINMLKQNQVDAIIIGSHTLKIDEYLKLKLPIVSLDMNFGESILSVMSDHRMGGKMAAKCLIANGCKNVVQIMGDMQVSTPSHQRHFSFEEEMKAHGINCRTIELKKLEFDIPNYDTVIDQILTGNDAVDGFFSVDLIAAKFIKRAVDLNYKIPEQIKVIGYDGTYIASLYNPRITTIRQPIELLASSIVENIIKLIDGEAIERNVIVHPVTLDLGQTTIR